MSYPVNPLLPLIVASALVIGCSSSDDDTTPADDPPGATTGTTGTTSGTTGGTSGDTTAGTTAGTTGGTTGTTGGDTGTTGGSSLVPGGDNRYPDYGSLPPAEIPQLDPSASPIPGPDPEDFFGYALEDNPATPVAGGPPTAPANLRVELVGNDWVELNWAPSSDDSAVVEYRLKRSDGHTYVIREDQTDPAEGTVAEIAKIWKSTSFIDCNYTRFLERLHECGIHRPAPGDIFSYQVTAVDDDGNESGASNTVVVRFHEDRGAAVPYYLDPHLDSSRFAQTHDLTSPGHFLDEFQLVFADEFDGSEVNADLWQTELVWADGHVINGEQQLFVSTQRDPDFGYDPFVFTDEGTLQIQAIPTPADLAGKLPDVCNIPGTGHCSFLSGALSSHDRFNMTYGYVEGRMKTSGVYGALSSFYLYHRYPGEGLERHSPEIDIIEYLGYNPYGDEDAFQTYHYSNVNTGDIHSSPTMIHKNETGELYSDEFHTYGVLWEPQLVIWYIDGREVKRLTGPQIGRRAMNIVTYLVTGSGWAPTPNAEGPFPIIYEIDYIRAWQRPPYNTNGLYPAIPPLSE